MEFSNISCEYNHLRLTLLVDTISKDTIEVAHKYLLKISKEKMWQHLYICNKENNFLYHQMYSGKSKKFNIVYENLLYIYKANTIKYSHNQHYVNAL